MSIVKEFKEFAVKGNVMDLAVGVIIGAAFGKIVSSLVSDLIMPPLGLLLKGIDFKEMKWTIKPSAGKVPEVAISYGAFIDAAIDFLIVAFVIFLLVKGINAIKRKDEAEAPTPEPTAPTKEEVLLTEIRDLLAKK